MSPSAQANPRLIVVRYGAILSQQCRVNERSPPHVKTEPGDCVAYPDRDNGRRRNCRCTPCPPPYCQGPRPDTNCDANQHTDDHADAHKHANEHPDKHTHNYTHTDDYADTH